MNGHLHHGDCRDLLATLPNDSIDAGVMDPPYGARFMGAAWDIDVPSVDIWRELLRVLKPGAFAAVMSLPRQDLQSAMVMRLKEAGFDIAFSPINWCYLTGFTKAADMGKKVDKKLGAQRETRKVDARAGTRYSQNAGNHRPWMDNPDHEIACGPAVTDEAKALDGSFAGFQPKPAFEPVLIAMKPLAEATYTAQALANGKGVSWLADCRIPFASDADSSGHYGGRNTGERGKLPAFIHNPAGVSARDPRGRIPANLLVSDDALNDEIVRSSGAKEGGKYAREANVYGGGLNVDGFASYGDEGSFSRCFDLDAWWATRVAQLPEHVQRVMPFLLVPKPTTVEKDAGLDAFPVETKVFNGQSSEASTEPKGVEQRFTTRLRNVHPTVKPVALMAYLITLFSRSGDTIIDLFAGSGSTLIAAELLDRKWLGAEMGEKHYQIAMGRLEYWSRVRGSHDLLGADLDILETPPTKVGRSTHGQLDMFEERASATEEASA